MFNIFRFELKRAMRSKLMWLIILLLVIISCVSISEIHKEKVDKNFRGYDRSNYETYLLGNNEEMKILAHGTLAEVESEAPEYVALERLRFKNIRLLVDANKQGNYHEVIKSEVVLGLLYAKLGWTQSKMSEVYFDKMAMPIWSHLNLGLNYEAVGPGPYTFNTEFKFNLLRDLQFYTALYEKDYVPIYKWDVNTHTYLSVYFNKFMPLFLGVVALLFSYNSINKEKLMGSLKLILTQGKKRRNYYLTKWLSSVVLVSLVVLVPCVIVSCFLWATAVQQPLDYPVLALKDGLERIKPIPNYVESVKSKLDIENMACEVLTPMPPRSPFLIADYHSEINPRVCFMPFYKYMAVAILVSVLYIAFILSLVMLVSAVVNNQTLSFVVSAIILTLGTVLSRSYTMGEHWNISPFGMSNGFRIVNGSYNVTPLMAILILGITTFVCLIVGIVYFKRKEI